MTVFLKCKDVSSLMNSSQFIPVLNAVNVQFGYSDFNSFNFA